MKILNVASIAVLALCGATVLAEEPAAGQLVSVTGKVWVQTPGQSESAAKAGTALAAGTRIRTGADGTAELTFADGSTLKVQPSSSMQLSAHKRQVKKKSSIVLFFGRVWSKVTRATSGEQTYEVNTPNAVCGVRGTEFETGVGDDGSTRVRVSDGKVGVDGDGDATEVDPGEETEADDEGVDDAGRAEEKAKWETWQKQKAERLGSQGKGIVDKMKGKIMSRKERLEALRAQQKDVEEKRKAAETKARAGDEAALQQIREYNAQLATIADQIAEVGDQAESQFGAVDHFADLAADPRFRMIDRKYLEAEAKNLRKIKAMFDKMVQEGTDISIQSMDQLLKDMGSGKTGSLKDKKGSTVKEMFDDDDMKMK